MQAMPEYRLTPTPDQPTWTAVIIFDDREVVLAERDARYGTLRDVAQQAVTEAAAYIREGLAKEARIDMWHRTKARGLENDRQAAYLWAERGKVYVQR